MQGFKIFFLIKGNSIVQLKQFNCSIEDKNDYTRGGTKGDMQKCNTVYIYCIAFDIAKMASTCISKLNIQKYHCLLWLIHES